MSVTVIEPGKLVRVEPEKVEPREILEFAAALIEKHGHRKRESGSTKEGYSIHGAIGEAANRVVGNQGKDHTDARPMRDAAAALLERHYGVGELQLNDTATSGSEVVDRLRAAAQQPGRETEA